MTGDTDGMESQESTGPDASGTDSAGLGEVSNPPKHKRHVLRTVFVILAAVALSLLVLVIAANAVMVNFVARGYLVPSESMEPTLHQGDQITVDKRAYHSSPPQPGEMIVFKAPPPWNVGYKSIRSHNAAIRWLQNSLSFIGFVPPDENDLVKRVVALGGQTVQCRNNTGLTVDGKRMNEPYLDPTTMDADPSVYPCLGPEFGPVTVPQRRLWVMGDNRTHSADSRAHCTSTAADAINGLLCTGDPMSGTVPVDDVIGKAKFIS